MADYSHQHVPVITAEPLTPALREAHAAAHGRAHSSLLSLPADGTLVLAERFEGTVTILAATGECPHGLDAAGRAWAQATGAAYFPVVADCVPEPRRKLTLSRSR